MSVIGKGTFSTIYKDTYGGEPCAIKYVDRGENSKRYIRREINIYKKLRGCKHVVKVLDYKIKSDGYIKYELLNKNLLQILHILTKDDIIRITAELEDALNEIHSLDVIHCDLKPENIMFDKNGTLKLIDFGNALTAAELNSSGQCVGTLPYRPPEYIIGAPLDNRVDLWAMGCIVVEMMTGNQLFNPKRDNDVYVYSYLLGEMINIFGNFREEFLKTGTRTHKYFDIKNKYTYKFIYLMGRPSSIYELLINFGYSKDDAFKWAVKIMPYFIR